MQETVYRWGSRYPWEWVILSEEGTTQCKVHGHCCEQCKTAESIEDSGAPKEPRVRWGSEPAWEEVILRGKSGGPV